MGLYMRKRLDSYSEIAIWRVTESNEELEQLITPDQLVALEKYKNPKRRKEKLAARVLLNKLLGSEALIFYDKHGKPNLAFSPYNISISHSGEYVAMALSLKNNVGVDIQYMTDKIYRVVPRFLNNDEYQNIHPSYPEESLHIHWCAKEALYKIHGEGNVNFANDLRVKPFRLKEKGKIKAEIVSPKTLDKEFELNYSAMEDDYMLVWSASN